MGALSNSKRDPFPISPDFHVSKKPRLAILNQTHSQTPGISGSISSPISRCAEPDPNPTLGFSNSTVSRIARYPESTSKFRREVHAPCRVLKYGSSRSTDTDSSEKKESWAHDMENYLSRNYNTAKKAAFGTLRHVIRSTDTDSSEKNESCAPGMENYSSRNYNVAKKAAFGTLRHVLKDKLVIGADNEVQKSQNELASADSSIEETEAMDEDGKKRRLILLDQSSPDGVLSNKDDDDDVKIVEERSVVTAERGAGVEHGVKRMDSLVDELDVEDLGSYKKLVETIEKRNERLDQLDFDIEMHTRKLSFYQSRPVKKPAEKDLSQEAFTPLTEEEEHEVRCALSRQCRRKVLVSHENSNIDITGEILSCLQPREWLNDEVINLYLELLKERGKREPKKYLNCHFFNTFFYKKLTSGAARRYDYKAVRRWTTERKLGYFLLECDKIFVPVHKDIHWCLAIINRKDKKFQYLDSLKGRDHAALEYLAKYYVDEVKDKSKKEIDVSDWEREFLEDIPAQQNGYDCGVFMIKYADFYSRDIGLCFSQEHMPYFRKRTAKEILRLRAD